METTRWRVEDESTDEPTRVEYGGEVVLEAVADRTAAIMQVAEANPDTELDAAYGGTVADLAAAEWEPSTHEHRFWRDSVVRCIMAVAIGLSMTCVVVTMCIGALIAIVSDVLQHGRTFGELLPGLVMFMLAGVVAGSAVLGDGKRWRMLRKLKKNLKRAQKMTE